MNDDSPQLVIEGPVAQDAPQILDTEQTIEESVSQEVSVAPPEVSEAPIQEQDGREAPVDQIAAKESESITGPPIEIIEPTAIQGPAIMAPIQQAEAPVVKEKTDTPIAESEQTVSAVEATVTPKINDPMEEAKKLPHEVLEAAFTLLSMERLDAMREAKKQKDKQKVEATSARIRDFIASYENGVRRTTIADKLNLSPSLVTDYLQRLVAVKAIRAEGNTNNRRFFVK